MADPIVVKVSELTELTDLATGDLITAVDISETLVSNKTKKLRAGNLRIFTAAQLADLIITENKLATGAVTNTKIATGAVTEEKIATNAITTTKIANDAITTAKIANDAVTNAKLADPYDTAVLIAADNADLLVVENGLISFLIPDTWQGKQVVQLAAWVASPSTSGSIIVRVQNASAGTTVGTVTIPQGVYYATTTSIINPSLIGYHVLRVDVTSAGSGARGLIVHIKVDKS